MAETNAEPDPEHAALRALVWTLADPARANRLLDVTGLGSRDLRDRAGDRQVLAATLRFLEDHEPDLIACAAELDLTPTALVAARTSLEKS